MKLTPDLSLTGQGLTSRVAFDPQALFAAGENGLWLDPADPATVFQDAAGTIPAAIDDPVGFIADKSGNGRHGVQPVAGARPILRADEAGRRYLDFDGVDDALESTLAGLGLASTMAALWCAYRGAGAGLVLNAAGDATNPAARGFALAHGPVDELRLGGAANALSAIPGATRSLALAWSRPAAEGLIGWDRDATGAASLGAVSESHPLVIGRRPGGDVFAGRLYGLIVRMGATEAALLTRGRNHMNRLAGVPLPAPAPATAPEAFGPGQWSLADTGTGGSLALTISALPADGGAVIAGLEYRLDGGAAVALAAAVPGSYEIAGLIDDQAYDVQLRALNAEGPGGWSDVKTATPTTAAAPATAPEAFGPGQWSLADTGTGGSLALAVSALPADGGAPITGLEYRLDGGAAVALPAAVPGSYEIAGLIDDQAYDVQLRALNAEGAGGWSDVRTATPTTAAAPSAWAAFDEAASDPGIIFSDIVTGGDEYRLATITGSANLAFGQAGEAEYLLVGGGGGGGAAGSAGGSGGGGAGGVLKFVAGETGNTAAGPLVVAASSYTVTIGAGGTGGTAGTQNPGNDGNETTAFALTALGGGGGGGTLGDARAGRSGASGGGGATANSSNEPGGAGTAGQGFAGGQSATNTDSPRCGGGGGGAGTAGQNAVTQSAGGDGGGGVQTAIAGTAAWFAGGGGGGAASGGTGGAGGLGGGAAGTTGAGLAAAPHSGGGGGGCGGDGNQRGGGAGADGVVYVRVRKP